MQIIYHARVQGHRFPPTRNHPKILTLRPLKDPSPGQGADTPYSGIGNATRYNPKLRYFPNLNENISVAKSSVFREQVRLDFRVEAFNAFNRGRFGTGSSTLQSQTFGILSSNGDLLNRPRQVQFALNLYF